MDILKHYSIGTNKVTDKLSGGSVNGVVKFHTETGIYVLKEYKKRWVTKQKLENIASTLIELKQKYNYPVAKPVLNNYGEFILENKYNFYEVTEYINGENYFENFNINKMIHSAKVLAKLHKETQIKRKKTHTSNSLDTNQFERLWDTSKGGSNNYVSVLDRISKKRKISICDKFILEKVLPFVQKHFQLLKINHHTVRNRKYISKIHNDFWPGQLIFKDNKVVAVIDFELMTDDFAEYDFVKAAQAFAHFSPNKVKEYDLDILTLFREAYEKIFGEIDLNENEILAFLRHGILGQICYWIETLEETQNEQILRDRHIHCAAKKLKWIAENEKDFVKCLIRSEN